MMVIPVGIGPGSTDLRFSHLSKRLRAVGTWLEATKPTSVRWAMKQMQRWQMDIRGQTSPGPLSLGRQQHVTPPLSLVAFCWFASIMMFPVPAGCPGSMQHRHPRFLLLHPGPGQLWGREEASRSCWGRAAPFGLPRSDGSGRAALHVFVEAGACDQPPAPLPGARSQLEPGWSFCWPPESEAPLNNANKSFIYQSPIKMPLKLSHLTRSLQRAA